jgi:hypothetical protein
MAILCTKLGKDLQATFMSSIDSNIQDIDCALVPNKYKVMRSMIEMVPENMREDLAENIALGDKVHRSFYMEEV